MWHHNPKNPLEVNAPMPAKPTPPAKLNATAEANKSNATMKMPSAEIRIGLSSIGKPKAPKIESAESITKMKKMKNLPKRTKK